MKNRLKRLLNNKGLTLTELIIVMFLTSVILAIALGLLVPVKNLMNGMKSNAHMDTINSTVNEYFRGTVQTATALTFIRLDADNTIKEEDRDTVKKFFEAHPGKVKAIAVLDVEADNEDIPVPIYRIFDFEAVPGNTELINLLYEKNEAEYGLFFDTFYEKASCAVEFYSGSTNGLQIASQCWKVNGDSLEFINQKHVLNFKLLNSALPSGFEGVSGDDESEETDAFVGSDTSTEEDASIEGHCYLILYTTL